MLSSHPRRGHTCEARRPHEPETKLDPLVNFVTTRSNWNDRTYRHTERELVEQAEHAYEVVANWEPSVLPAEKT